MHARAVVYIYLAWGKVSCLERCPQFKCMQERLYLGWGKVSCLERCPQFRGVLSERFHCIRMPQQPLRIQIFIHRAL